MDDKKTGLPADAGNGMSERSGHYDESDSGRTDTPVGQPTQDTTQPDAVPGQSGGRPGLSESGTSFDTDPSGDKDQ